LPVAGGSLSGLFGSSGPALDLTLSLHSGLDQLQNQYASGIRFSSTIASRPSRR